MREPFETLLGQYRDHALLGDYLQGYVPRFFDRIEDGEVRPGLFGSDVVLQISSGELLMLHIGLAFWNGDRTARVADLARLDPENRQRVTDALYLAMEAFR